MTARVLIVSPVRNEAAHIECVVRAVAAQTRPPAQWVVVDDDSSDDTLQRLRALAHEVDFLQVCQHGQTAFGGARDRLALAAAPRAFNFGLDQVEQEHFTHILKLDGDVELPPDYLERLLERFDSDPRLGIAGADLIEPRGDGMERIRIPRQHVHGALKCYTRACFDAIGGVHVRLGWDTIDETYARMHGFRTFSFPDIVAVHHRPHGSADGTLRGRARHGECAYIAHFGPVWVFLRSLKVALSTPVGLSGAAFLFGYLRAAVRRAEQVPDPEFRRFARRELRTRMRRSPGAAMRSFGAPVAEPRSPIDIAEENAVLMNPLGHAPLERSPLARDHAGARTADLIRSLMQRSPVVRSVVKSGPVQHQVRTGRAMTIVRGRRRFLAHQIASTCTGRYELRGCGLTVHVRHRSGDVAILNKIFARDAARNSYEPPEQIAALLAAATPRILDVGANIGLFGVFALSRWPAAVITAYEPDPSNQRVLRQTVAANDQDGRWNVVPAAVSNAPGELSFVPDLGAEAHIAHAHERETITVPTVDFFDQIADGVDLVKLDIEGGEWAILADERLATADISTIRLEWHDFQCPVPDARAEAIRLFNAAGFNRIVDADHEQEANGVLWAWREQH